MNTRLLKINAMKRFYNWSNMTGDHGTIADCFWMMSVKAVDQAMQKQQDINERNNWFIKRKNAAVSYERGHIADALLNYIKKRKKRKNIKSSEPQASSLTTEMG
tara:strand:- start:193 stop:504 length:312 start_codon:yes stop_codon:yes gene_type:complete